MSLAAAILALSIGREVAEGWRPSLTLSALAGVRSLSLQEGERSLDALAREGGVTATLRPVASNPIGIALTASRTTPLQGEEEAELKGGRTWRMSGVIEHPVLSLVTYAALGVARDRQEWRHGDAALVTTTTGASIAFGLRYGLTPRWSLALEGNGQIEWPASARVLAAGRPRGEQSSASALAGLMGLAATW